MILEPGSFRVSDYRNNHIPTWVKIVCAIRAFKDFRYDGEVWSVPDINAAIIAWVRSLRFDHRPPLQDRPYDTEAKDFIPPQHDPDHIEAIPDKAHDQRTFGRKEDAEKTVTTRGSDAGERKHIRLVSGSQELHDAKMAAKGGDPKALAHLLGVEKQRRRKSKIPSRPFPKRRSA